jgi:hypothetical protein
MIKIGGLNMRFSGLKDDEKGYLKHLNERLQHVSEFIRKNVELEVIIRRDADPADAERRFAGATDAMHLFPFGLPPKWTAGSLGSTVAFKTQSYNSYIFVDPSSRKVEYLGIPSTFLLRYAVFDAINLAADASVIHASAISFDNTLFLLVGARTSGKTTLTHCLLKNGGKLLSEDFTLVSNDGRVYPFNRESMTWPETLRTFGIPDAAVTNWLGKHLVDLSQVYAMDTVPKSPSAMIECAISKDGCYLMEDKPISDIVTPGMIFADRAWLNPLFGHDIAEWAGRKRAHILSFRVPSARFDFGYDPAKAWASVGAWTRSAIDGRR